MKDFSQLTDFQVFLLKNNLKNNEVAAMLGVSSPFISALKTGKSKLALKHYQILSEKGYDISMLGKAQVVQNNHSGDNNYIEHNDGEFNIGKIGDSLDRLSHQLDVKDEQIEQYRQHVDKLMQMMDAQNNTIQILNKMIKDENTSGNIN